MIGSTCAQWPESTFTDRGYILFFLIMLVLSVGFQSFDKKELLENVVGLIIRNNRELAGEI